ncbi:MAG: hypothetical protein A4E19_18025 [Nitrospira sp. SG-bin1]|nr:MAG: hypothetical protein A4E19_18025 [Nitrospira sp. SG-bin1]
MLHALLLLGLLLMAAVMPAQATTYDDPYKSSWEQQRETYRKHGYDTYRNGPLPETLEQQRREERRREEYRRDSERQRQEQLRDLYRDTKPRW